MATYKVFIAVPAYDHTVGYDFAMSLFRTAEVFKDEGIDSEMLFMGGNAYVDLARDILLHRFLRTSCSHILQLDADVGWNPEDVIRLLRHEKDFVAGIYPAKRVEPTFMVNFNSDRENGLIGADGVPGGFCLIKRHVIEGALLHHADLIVEGIPELPGEKMAALHSHHVHGGRFWGEDMGFCRRIKEAGYKIWVDPLVNLRHWSGGDCYDHKLIGNLVRARA